MKIRKVFIDCGVWTGDSIKAFKEYDNSYEIYGFECEPRLNEVLKKLSKEHTFNFINKAVWVKDEQIKLFPGENDLTQSSSLYSEKKKYIDRKNPVKVDAIDFSSLIMKTFKKEDYIICKMNIEGAEYDILEKMVADKSIDYINKLFISWHWKKLKGFPKDRHDKIKSQVEKRTKLLKWKFVEGETGNPF
jgi:FkbM family methyltransferase